MSADNRQLLLKVVRLAWPVFFTNLLQSLVSVVDTFMVGRLSPIAIAAVGMSNAVRFLVVVMILSVAAGAMSLMAQATGAKDPMRMSNIARQAITSGIMFAIGLTAIGIVVARPLLTLINSGGDPAAVEMGTTYLHILFGGTIFLVLNFIIGKLMQGAGDTLTPLILTIVINLLNILFNYMFMFGVGGIPAFGLSGAAIGTVISRFLGVIAGLAVIYSNRNVVKILPGTYMPDLSIIKDILNIGVPSGIQGLFRNGARLLVIGIITSTEVGTYGVAALAIGIQVESLAFMPVLGLSVASTTLVGQALGSGMPHEARQRGNMSISLGVFVMAVLVAPMIIFAPQIIRLFDPSANEMVLAAGTSYFRINTVALPIAAIAMVGNGVLRGAGDSKPGMFGTIIGRVVFTLPLAWLLGIYWGYGSSGVWIALTVGVIVDAAIVLARWRGNAWKQVAEQYVGSFD